MNHTEEFPFNLICPYQFIPTMKKNEKVKEFLTPLFSAATKHIVEENRDSVSWNVLRLAEKEKEKEWKNSKLENVKNYILEQI